MRGFLGWSAAVGLSVAIATGMSSAGSAQQAQDSSSPSGRGIQGPDTARGNARNEGVSAAPAAVLPPGTYDPGNGLSFLLNYTGEFATNPSGGLRQGATFAGQLFAGADADLNRIAGIQGGSAHVIFTDRQGRNLAGEYIGNDTSVQEIYGGGQTYRLTLLSYEQKFFNDRVDIEAGRLPAQGSFLVSPIYCNFQNNATCGSPTTAFKDTNFTYFPVSTWGGHGRLWLDPAKTFFFHVGAYEVHPSTTLPSDHGFNWSTDGATGAVIPMELGYSTTFANDRLPRNYGVGAIIDQSKYSDPTLDSAGGQAFFSGLDPATQFGRSVVYARFDQMVWRPDPNSPEGLTLFGLVMGATGGRQTQNYFIEGGAVLTGTFSNRPYDTIAFVASNQNYSSLGLADANYSLAQQGGRPGTIPTNQVMMELNYGLQINPAARFTPQFQYIINPTNPSVPYKRIPDAFVIGGKISVDLFTLAGLAKGPGSL